MPHPDTRPLVPVHRLSALASAALAFLVFASSSQAMEIDTGNPDVVLRWDNTLRYNLGQRTQGQDPGDPGATRTSTMATATSTRIR